MYSVVRAVQRSGSTVRRQTRRTSDATIAQRRLTLAEEQKILVPFARAFYRSCRAQQECGLLTPNEACKELKNLFYQESMAWVLMLALLLTALLTSLFNAKMPDDEEITDQALATGWPRNVVIALEILYERCRSAKIKQKTWIFGE